MILTDRTIYEEKKEQKQKSSSWYSIFDRRKSKGEVAFVRAYISISDRDTGGFSIKSVPAGWVPKRSGMRRWP